MLVCDDAGWHQAGERDDRRDIRQSGQEPDLQGVRDPGLLDQGRQPEADDVDAAGDAEVDQAQQPDPAGLEGARQVGKPLLLLVLAVNIVDDYAFFPSSSHFTEATRLSR